MTRFSASVFLVLLSSAAPAQDAPGTLLSDGQVEDRAVAETHDAPTTVGIDSDSLLPFADAEGEAAEGRALFIAGDHAAALTLLMPLAEAGNPVAQNIVGVAYTEPSGDLGLDYDAQAGFDLLLASAEQGYPRAMNNLAVMYEEAHDGIGADRTERFGWFLKAAEAGYEDSFRTVAEAYANGDGVATDDDAAFAWASRAFAEVGDADATYLMGDMHYFGIGTPPNYGKAYGYFVDAAAGGHVEAIYSLGYMTLYEEGVPSNPPAAWMMLESAAQDGSLDALSELTLMAGSGRWAGYWESDVAARGYCLALDSADYLAELGADSEVTQLCGGLAGTLSSADESAAKAIAQDFAD
ncbi:tetratricopeptide repeat protein [Pelagovum pacificum]|nr:tetratricopeptide repeat protein [Pelagovum pacificum]QQA44665.1 sel1 repeat family protein [Pelagovum pacificum]